jgi:hypothetical protein
MVRTIAGILVGIVIAVASVFAIEQIVHLFAPAPPGFDMRDPEQVRARVSSLPATAFLLVLLGWVLGTGLGSWAAVRISRTGMRWPGLAVGAAIVAATLYNLVTIPHPIWFAAIALIGIPIASWLGARAGAPGAVREIAP